MPSATDNDYLPASLYTNSQSENARSCREQGADPNVWGPTDPRRFRGSALCRISQAVSAETLCAMAFIRPRGNVLSCRDEVCRITVSGMRARLRMRTSEPRDRASLTLTASVHQTDIDYGAWSSRRGNPHAYPPASPSGPSTLLS
jgi:hypothetical protein